jgi:hypothetical protein
MGHLFQNEQKIVKILTGLKIISIFTGPKLDYFQNGLPHQQFAMSDAATSAKQMWHMLPLQLLHSRVKDL